MHAQIWDNSALDCNKVVFIQPGNLVAKRQESYKWRLLNPMNTLRFYEDLIKTFDFMCFYGITSPLIIMCLGSIVNTLGSL